MSGLGKVRPIYLAGQTASGKSAIALELGKRMRGEIISVDSMQVYQGMDIGTAKPLAIERAQVPHHLLDIATLNEVFDVGRFLSAARDAQREIESRGCVPIFCGGTGFYFKALLCGIGEAPPSDPKLRAELEATPLADLLQELERKDPDSFQRIDRKNPRRVIRAVEVLRTSGRLIAEQRASWKDSDSVFLAGLKRGPEDLRKRQSERVDEMFRQGLVEETKRLKELGLARNQGASQAIGYKQVLAHLEGRMTLAETMELVKRKTWQYARRQQTWLTHQLPVRWLEIAPEESPQQSATRIIEGWKTITSTERAKS